MKSIFLTILATCCLLPVMAQQTTGKDSLLNREMTLEKEYNPTIREAVKLSRLPELREPQSPKSNVEFSNYEIPFNIQSQLTPLSPQAYLTNLNNSKYKAYLTAGISSQLDIDGDLGYRILNTSKNFLGIFISHRSSNYDATNLQCDSSQNLKFSDTWGGMDFRHEFGAARLNIDAKYTASSFNYSAFTITNYDPASSIFFEPVYQFYPYPNQANRLFEFHTGVETNEPDKTNYAFNLFYTYYKQKYGLTTEADGLKETTLKLDWKIYKTFNSNMEAGLKGFYKGYIYPDSFPKWYDKGWYDENRRPSVNSNYSVLSLNPYFYMEDEYIHLLLGAKVDVEFGGWKKVVAAPAIRFNYFPSEKFSVYLNAEGGRNDNSCYSVFYENRYVHPSFRIWDSRTPLDGTVGVKLLPLSNLSVDIFGGYKITQDEHFFYPDFLFEEVEKSIAGTVIKSSYGDANTLKAGANFKYAFQDIFEIDLKGVYYKWSVSKINEGDSFADVLLPEAWHKPNFVADLDAAYRLPSLPLKFNLLYHGAFGRKTLDALHHNRVEDMKSINDVSLKTTFLINSFFSAYLKANNLLFQKYDLWYSYPAQNFNIMAGLSVLF